MIIWNNGLGKYFTEITINVSLKRYQKLEYEIKKPTKYG